MSAHRPHIGLDVGQRRIGVAGSNEAGTIAMPVETVEVTSRRAAAEQIAELVAEGQTHTAVVGWPLTLEGQEGRAVRRVERFVACLEEVLEERDLQVDLIMWDERLTTHAAEDFLIGADVSRRRRKEVVDQIAAAHILQGYLDSNGSDQQQQDE